MLPRNNEFCTAGFMTVEAAVLVPFLLVFYISFTYLLIFCYDRALLSQDAYSLAVCAKTSYFDDPDSMDRKMADKVSELIQMRPYVAASDMSVDVTKEGMEITVDCSVEFRNPLAGIFGVWPVYQNGTITASKKISVTNPVDVMRMLEGIFG